MTSDATTASGPVTYGELLDLATAHLTRAALALAHQPPASGGALTRTVTAYREVIHAFGGHLAAVLNGRSRWVMVDEATHDALVEAGRLKTALQRAVPVRPRDLPRDGPGSVIGCYRDAARTLRAASDLLATHLDPATGQARSPEATRLRYLGERGPVVRRLAALVAATAETEHLMRRLAGDVQNRGEVLGVGLPDLGRVRETASATLGETVLTHARGDPAAAPVFDQATVARPTVRTADPFTEITDRVAVIRRAAWDLLHQEHPSLHAITDIARLATHIEATRFRLTAHRTTPLSSVTAPKAAAWHQVWTELRQLRGLTPPDADIRGHSRAVEGLIARCARPGPADTRRGPAPDGAGTAVSVIDLGDPENRRRLAAVLRDAGDQLAETAPSTHTTLDRLTHARQLYVPAGPAEIGEGTLTWHAGKPHWQAGTIPPDKTRAVNAAYRTLDAAYTGPPAATVSAPALGAGPQSA
ncbi:MAG: hypothetical protein WAL50_14890 [Kineosporiaceae bacterium]